MNASLPVALGLLAVSALLTVTSPYHPDIALVAINLALAAGCAVESARIVWQQ